MKHKTPIIFLALILLVSLFTFAKPDTVNATNYKPYSYWYKRDNYRTKPRTVIITRSITIRKIRWLKNSVTHYLSNTKKKLKRGTKVKITATSPHNYYWALLGKGYYNWAYPHKKTNWFETESEYIQDELQRQKRKEQKLIAAKYKKYDIFLKNQTFYIKNQGEFSFGDAVVWNHQINLFSSFTNKSKHPINIADFLKKYFSITTSDTTIAFSPEDKKNIQPGKSSGIMLVSSPSPAYQVGAALKISSSDKTNLRSNNKVLQITLK